MLLVLKFERLMINYHRFFEKKAFYFLQKNAKKVEKVFGLYFYKTRFELGKFYYQNDQRKKLYKSWKFQWYSNVVLGLTWRNLMNISR
jgi:hypothetical protein